MSCILETRWDLQDLQDPKDCPACLVRMDDLARQVLEDRRETKDCPAYLVRVDCQAREVLEDHLVGRTDRKAISLDTLKVFTEH